MAHRLAVPRALRRKRWLVATLLLLVLAVTAVAAAGVTSPSKHGAPAGSPRWQRVFEDDFSHGLTTSVWGRYSGQPGGDPGGWWAPSHVVVRNGILNLETYRDPRFQDRWVSGGVAVRRPKQTYGRYLVRFRVDRGSGIAAVLLLWPSGNQWPPEIDFAENGGTTAARDAMTATLHYGAQNRIVQHTIRANFTRWHVMGVEWSPSRIVYTLDGRPWASVGGARVPSQPMHLALQSQAGTCGDRFAPCPGPATPRHVNLQIDWVAAYAYRGSARR